MRVHSQATLEVVLAAFPKSLADDVRVVMRGIPPADVSLPEHDRFRAITALGECAIPSRVYFPELAVTASLNLTDAQAAILAAIFTRHYSGYQREIWAVQLLSQPSAWSTPFVALLFKDYVQEILTALEQRMSEDWRPFIQAFAVQNPLWLRQLSHQIVNYWAVYHRQKFPRLTDYSGYKLARRMGVWDNKTAPNLTRSRPLEGLGISV
ncbi:hypothetical protein [Prosthecobacter sp.]|uniref:hypothetical protein n=1 Tax=Prosthecobacter sp. TaxID=1965333 RepID=UPI0037835CAD